MKYKTGILRPWRVRIRIRIRIRTDSHLLSFISRAHSIPFPWFSTQWQSDLFDLGFIYLFIQLEQLKSHLYLLCSTLLLFCLSTPWRALGELWMKEFPSYPICCSTAFGAYPCIPHLSPLSYTTATPYNGSKRRKKKDTPIKWYHIFVNSFARYSFF